MIPLISQEVCSTLNEELGKEGIDCLHRTMENLKQLQPHLFQELAQGGAAVAKMHGISAGESSLRLSVVIYKLIEAQLDVNQLEESL